MVKYRLFFHLSHPLMGYLPHARGDIDDKDDDQV